MWHYPHPATACHCAIAGADRQLCGNRSILPALWAHGSKPAAAAVRRDRQTNARQFHRPCCTLWAVLIMSVKLGHGYAIQLNSVLSYVKLN